MYKAVLCENKIILSMQLRTMKVPAQLHYSSLHLWVKHIENDLWETGITDYAQDLLGDIVFLQAPQIGSKLEKDMPCGLVESVKTSSDLHAPLSGLVTEINESLINAPEGLNDEPYKSWIFKFSASNPEQVNDLLNAEEYTKLIES